MNPTTFYFKNGGGDWTKQDNNLWTGSDLDVFSPTLPVGHCRVLFPVMVL